MDLSTRFMRHVHKTRACWLWEGAKNHDGYGRITIGGRKGKQVLAHRVSYTLFIGPIPEGMYVLHTCDVRNCVRPSHLYAGTFEDNMADAVERNRFTPTRARGSNHPLSKLTEADIPIIRARLAAGETQTVIAADYGVAQSKISNVKTGKSWTHL